MDGHNRPVKLTVPNLPSIAKRKKILKKIEQSHCRVIWVGAPAGSGKTTLIADYARSFDRRCLWYEVDRGDRDPAVFFQYMAVAASWFLPSDLEIPLFSLENQMALEAYTRTFFSKVFGLADGPRLVVFDNVHDVADTGAFLDWIQVGLSHISENMKVVFISRENVPENLLRYNANRQLLVLDWHDLRLDDEECEQIIRLHGHEADAGDLASQIGQLVDGWAAGLILMLQSAGSDGQPLNISDLKGNLQAPFAYFATEVLRQLPDDHQEILKRTGLLSSFTVKEAEQLCDNAVKADLDELCRLNTLIRRTRHPSLPEQNGGNGEQADGTVYQYHPLFRSFLREIVKNDHDRDGVGDLHMRAARIAMAAGRLNEAVELFSEIEYWPGLVALCREHARHMLVSGRQWTLIDWISRIPEEVRDQDPWLLYFFGQSLLILDSKRARKLMIRAHEIFSGDGDLGGRILSWSGVATSYHMEWADFSNAKAWDALASEFPPLDEDFPDPMIVAEFCKARLDLLTWCDLGSPDADEMAERCFQLLTALKEPLHIAQVATSVIFFHMMRGNMPAASLAADIMQSRLENAKNNPISYLASRIILCHFMWNCGRMTEALAAAHQAVLAAKEIGTSQWDLPVYAARAWVDLAIDDRAGTNQALTAVKRVVDPARTMQYAQYLTLSAQLALHEEETSMARHLAMEAYQLLESAYAPYPLAVAIILLAQIHLAQDNFDDAEALREKLWDLAQATRSRLVLIYANILDAELAMGKGDRADAVAKVGTALAESRKGALLVGAPIAANVITRTCVLALENDVEVDQARWLIQARRLRPPKDGMVPESWPWPIRIETLGRFQVALNGEPLVFTRKAQRRPIDLLKLLCISNEGRASVSHICDCLWPESDGDSAYSAFTSTLSRLKKLLGDDQAVVQRSGMVLINREVCDWDLSRLDQMLRSNQFSAGHLVQMQNLVSGALLPGDDILPGLETARKSWEYRIKRITKKFAQLAEQNGDVELAGGWHDFGARINLRGA